MRRIDTRSRESTVYRIVVGCANLALAAMLVFGIIRFTALIVPRYGRRFSFFAVVMAGLACWMLFRGVVVLVGRSHGAR